MMANFLEKRFHLLFYIGLILGLGLSFLYASHQILTGDQLQMLSKGYLAARKDIWLNYGNAASAMGNVPGSLSTILVAVPLKLVDSPYSPMILLLALRLIGFLLFDSIIKKIYSSDIRLLFMVLCWLNPWFLFESLLYNPSYLFFFSAIHLWSAFQMRTSPSFWYSFLHILSIGMTLQLHYSWPILVIITAYIFYTKTIKLNWIGVLSGALVTLASLIPYFMEVMASPAILHNTDEVADARYIGWGGIHVYPVFKAMLYWLRYSSFLFPNKLITGASFDWLPITDSLKTYVVYVWRAILFGLGGISIIVSCMASFVAWKKIRPVITVRQINSQTIHGDEWLLLYTTGAFFSVVISAILSPITLIYWHLMLVFPFALFPVISFIFNNQKTLYKYISLNSFLLKVVIYFIFVNLIAANDSHKYSYNMNYRKQTEIYLNSDNNYDINIFLNKDTIR